MPRPPFGASGDDDIGFDPARADAVPAALGPEPPKNRDAALAALFMDAPAEELRA
jgi:hypothetical protein